MLPGVALNDGLDIAGINMTNDEKQELIEHIREKVLEIPTRTEPLGGQNYKYVRLEEVLDVLQEDV